MRYAQICKEIRYITIGYETNSFRKFIEKPREFIEFYGKYDYFHYSSSIPDLMSAPPRRERAPLTTGFGGRTLDGGKPPSFRQSRNPFCFHRVRGHDFVAAQCLKRYLRGGNDGAWSIPSSDENGFRLKADVGGRLRAMRRESTKRGRVFQGGGVGGAGQTEEGGFAVFTLARIPDSMRKPPLPSVQCRPMRWKPFSRAARTIAESPIDEEYGNCGEMRVKVDERGDFVGAAREPPYGRYEGKVPVCRLRRGLQDLPRTTPPCGHRVLSKF